MSDVSSCNQCDGALARRAASTRMLTGNVENAHSHGTWRSRQWLYRDSDIDVSPIGVLAGEACRHFPPEGLRAETLPVTQSFGLTPPIACSAQR
jgi:hypothetical protein